MIGRIVTPCSTSRTLWREDVAANWRVWAEYIRITRTHRLDSARRVH